MCEQPDDFDAETDDLLLAYLDGGMPVGGGEAIPNSEPSDVTNKAVLLPKADSLNDSAEMGRKDEGPSGLVFPFPYPQPYDIQLDFMRNLYTCLEEGKFGIFESPTGTGKSLSLICGALAWLRNHQKAQEEENAKKMAALSKARTFGSTKDWVEAFKIEKEQKAARDEVEKRQKELESFRERIAFLRNPPRKVFQQDAVASKFRVQAKGSSFDVEDDENSNLLSRENDTSVASENDELDLIVQDETPKLGQNLEKGPEDDTVRHTQIFYCSRTHSQLSQFVSELKRSPFASEVTAVVLGSRQNLCINEAVRDLKSLSLMNQVCLEMKEKRREKTVCEPSEDGRKRRKVRKKQNLHTAGCKFCKASEVMGEFADGILAEIRDIEDLAQFGKENSCCPYYGSRAALRSAQLVCLPYNILLHKNTRQQCGIELTGNVVLVDEAHNLLETLSAVHSVTVSGSHLQHVAKQLSSYVTRYELRFTAENLRFLRRVQFMVKRLLMFLGLTFDGTQPSSTKFINTSSDSTSCSTLASGPLVSPGARKLTQQVMTINDFLFATSLDDVNMFQVLQFCSRSQLSRKLRGFVDRRVAGGTTMGGTDDASRKEVGGAAAAASGASLKAFLKRISKPEVQKSSVEQTVPEGLTASYSNDKRAKVTDASSSMLKIEELFEAWTNPCEDGRIFVTPAGCRHDAEASAGSGGEIKFLLLNPAAHFADVIRDSRAVILAGGTMAPYSDLVHQLSSSSVEQTPSKAWDASRLHYFTCSHIIPEKNLLPIALSHGPSGRELDFTYENRNDPQALMDLGHLFRQLFEVVPGGVVIFAPSYSYADLLQEKWKSAGLLRELASKKPFLVEQRRTPKGQDTAYEQYCKLCEEDSARGAALLCVVGGKLSEGINFSDHLGRCVIMVGMPYPNVKSRELQEKMKYLDRRLTSCTEPVAESTSSRSPGQQFYHNTCMKSVNQSIGRAIRHRGDYACILLLDRRYQKPTVLRSLPGWIQKRVRCFERSHQAFNATKEFFGQFL